MDKCQYMISIQGRNCEGETKGELDWCDLSDNPCQLMSGDTCEDWEKIKKEEEYDNNNN